MDSAGPAPVSEDAGGDVTNSDANLALEADDSMEAETEPQRASSGQARPTVGDVVVVQNPNSNHQEYRDRTGRIVVDAQDDQPYQIADMGDVWFGEKEVSVQAAHVRPEAETEPQRASSGQADGTALTRPSALLQRRAKRRRSDSPRVAADVDVAALRPGSRVTYRDYRGCDVVRVLSNGRGTKCSWRREEGREVWGMFSR